MLVEILKKRWKLRFTRLKINRGECDSPTTPGKEIRIDSELRGEELLEVVTHEVVHAALWHLDEEYVEATAHDLARILWRLGLRFPDDE